MQIADCVYYGLDSFGKERQRWRITSFLRRVEEQFPAVHSAEIEDPGERLMHEVLGGILLHEKLQRESLGQKHTRRFRYQWCLPEEATHCELVAICGAIAPLTECEFVREVDWSREHIDKERAEYRKSPLLGRLTDWRWE